MHRRRSRFLAFLTNNCRFRGHPDGTIRKRRICLLPVGSITVGAMRKSRSCFPDFRIDNCRFRDHPDGTMHKTRSCFLSKSTIQVTNWYLTFGTIPMAVQPTYTYTYLKKIEIVQIVKIYFSGPKKPEMFLELDLDRAKCTSPSHASFRPGARVLADHIGCWIRWTGWEPVSQPGVTRMASVSGDWSTVTLLPEALRHHGLRTLPKNLLSL